MQLLHINVTSRCLDTITVQSNIYSQGVCRMIDKNLIAGLTGSSQSEYVKTFVTVAKEEVGARCCVFNYRGRGGVSLASPKTYCASDPSDLGEVPH